MNENSLCNPSFEVDWSEEESHECLVITADGEVHERDVGSIFTPSGWITWFEHIPDMWDQPEVRDVHLAADPVRVHDGVKAILMFSFYRRHQGGFAQKVQVTPGQLYELKGFAHAWSNHNLAGHEDCYDAPRCSCGVGSGAAYYTEETAPRFVEGEHWNNAIRNVRFTLGVDPTGGSDPFSGDIIWGAGAYIYNKHAPVPPVVFEAEVPVATVYLRSHTQFPFKHNDTYWDTISLTPYTSPDPTPGRGQPRVQYARTYVLAPPDAEVYLINMIANTAWNTRRYTIGGSADDAGIGDLDHRRVVIIEPESWPGGTAGIVNFYEEYYPGVSLVLMPGDPTTIQAQLEQLVENDNFPFNPTPPPGEPYGLLLWQCDPRWKNERIASPGCSLTLCQTGCWISASAMAQMYYGIKHDATPSSANQALGAVGGFSGCLTLWSGMKDALGLEVVKKTYDDDEAKQWLDSGNVCFAEVEPETYMHFVLVTGCNAEGRFHMLDPYKNVEGWVDEYYPGVESWRLIRPFDISPPVPLNLVDPHMQTVEPGILVAQKVAGKPSLMQKILGLYYTWQYNRQQTSVRASTFKYVRDAKPNYVKVFSFEDVFGVLRAHPGALVGVRHYTNDYDGIIDVDPALGAKRWVDLFRDALYTTCARIDIDFPNIKKPYFYMESPNELYPSDNAPLVARAAALDQAIALEVERTGLPIATIGYCAGVGNPLEEEYPLLVPLARTLERTGGAMGLHLYWWADRTTDGLVSWWPYHAGRYQEVDKVLVQHGVHVDWLCGESGVVASEDGGHHLNAHSGWSDVMSWELYLLHILEVNRRDNEWNRTHGGRFKGRAYFTTCATFCNWFSFRLGQPEFEDIARALAG